MNNQEQQAERVLCEQCEQEPVPTDRNGRPHCGPWGELCRDCENAEIAGTDDRTLDMLGIPNASWA